MTRDHSSVWDNCLQTIRRNVNSQSFKTWFEPIRPVRLENNALTIQVPNKFFYEWLEEHYVALLKMTIRKELGDKGRLEYQILMSLQNAARAARSGEVRKSRVRAEDPAMSPGGVDTQHIKNPFVIPGIKKLKIDPQLNKSYQFKNYIEGDCNRLARSAGSAVAKNPGGTAFNPLVIFGDVGLGKTHLAHAIGNEVLEKFPNKTVLYVSSEKFTNQIIESIRNNAVNDFVNFYQLVDLLIVDDIQFLANKQKTQEIFFHIFNQLHQKGKQIVLTSDRPPKDLDGMEERLISRFKWGLTADLGIPDFETRMAILEAKMSREGVNIPYDVIEFICFNIKNNIRELEGVLVSLIAQSSLNRREIDMDLAKEVIKNFVSQINKEITVEYIQQLVADHFDLPVD
ncbi:MAG: chromosomal replication initiator protein DnaA, partial [Phaeodactylibacter sp.]|nr:chromosomal replication initiator protein DnaA [Phaeodactylibacter sp.]